MPHHPTKSPSPKSPLRHTQTQFSTPNYSTVPITYGSKAYYEAFHKKKHLGNKRKQHGDVNGQDLLQGSSSQGSSPKASSQGSVELNRGDQQTNHHNHPDQYRKKKNHRKNGGGSVNMSSAAMEESSESSSHIHQHVFRSSSVATTGAHNPSFYTESQHLAYNPFKSTEYQILKEDRYAKQKHLCNERRLEPMFLSVLMQECDKVQSEMQLQLDTTNVHTDGLSQLLHNLESYHDKLRHLKSEIKTTEKQLKEKKAQNAMYFKDASVRPDKILPQIQQNKQKIDFLRDLRLRCEKLRRTNQDLRHRIQQFTEDSSGAGSVSGTAAGMAGASSTGGEVHEMMRNRAMSMLPLKVNLIEDSTNNEEIRINCSLNEETSMIHLSLVVDRMNGRLKDVHVFQKSVNDTRQSDVTVRYKDIVQYSIEKNDLEFLVGELYAAVYDEDGDMLMEATT
uniref:Uncharacterized protein n=1 Tax=Percolomonas cosmopolitus TaxID=63605 RepID=A0A7S1KPH9_9EUKA|mmetsp:Transcript_3066/g.11781  ORF Transcript_3066/g.11781 Transcript_3066/m.11781 type:complete len:450 (+) Transcript_3066:178-1527(+)|eukprot:CAMPEP_0117434990 /NCGR_PEP_ID=MMETSP0759-20121206/241_1 /TAXON_ID=63605 /ORGANISM="Percolomonas cosmopolitus, Strain WS" /LENGTH=449 /DNA_ID=CAMNT_0005226505 /DNA_START=156 /DNA_END=1505 /DNA_ORIENTATION=-